MATDRKERDKARRLRKMQVLSQLHLLSGSLCDSHNRKDKKREVETLAKMLAYIIELMPRQRINDERRDSLGRIFEASAFGETPTIQIDKEFGNMLFINGHFDVGELSKRIVWGDSVSGQLLQEVNGGTND